MRTSDSAHPPRGHVGSGPRLRCDAAVGLPDRLATHEPRVLLRGVGDFALDLEVSVWVDDPWQSRVGQSDLNQAICRALERAGITIPFPQRDLHVVPAPARAARVRAADAPGLEGEVATRRRGR